MGDCQNYGRSLGPLNQAPYLRGTQKRDHNFDNPPHEECAVLSEMQLACLVQSSALKSSSFLRTLSRIMRMTVGK